MIAALLIEPWTASSSMPTSASAPESVLPDCPDCPSYGLIISSDTECCCKVTVNGEEITAYPWVRVYDRGTHIILEASGGECCEFLQWKIYTEGFDSTYKQGTVSFYMGSNISAQVTNSLICSPTLEVTPTPIPTPTQTPEATAIPASTPEVTPTPEPEVTSTPTPTPAETLEVTPTPTSTPEVTPTSAPEVTSTLTPTPTQMPEATAIPASTPEITPTPTMTPGPAQVVRDLPSDAQLVNQTFTVTVTFTAPSDGFNAIGLTDNVPAGWTVQGSVSSCTPNANGMSIVGSKIQYAWYGIYPSGQAFTATYSVTVPAGTADGTYTFTGHLTYFVGGVGPTTEAIAGDQQVTVGIVAAPTPEVTTTLTPTPTQMPEVTATPASTPEVSPTATPEETTTLTPTPAQTPDATAMPAATPEATPTPTPTPSPEALPAIPASAGYLMVTPISTPGPPVIPTPTSTPRRTPRPTPSPTAAPTLTATPTLTPTPTPLPVAGAAVVPWSTIGGIIGGAMVLGSLFFLVMRSRTRRALPADAGFAIIPLPKASTKEDGKDVFYILSGGRMIRVTPGQDNKAKS